MNRFMELLSDRRGDVYGWVAVVMLVVALPLSSLTIDLTRMMYVRGHLQTASDSACQAAANALDAPTFRASGIGRIEPGLARSYAGTVFNATLADRVRVDFNPSLSVGFTQTQAHCTATATVRHIVPLTPAMNITVYTVSEMRTRTVP